MEYSRSCVEAREECLELCYVSFDVNTSVLLLQGLTRSEAGAEPPLLGFIVPATKPVGTVFIMLRQDKSGVFEQSLGKLFIKGIGMSLFFSKRSLFLLVCVGIFIKIDQTTFCFQYSFSELSYLNLLHPR